MTNSPTKSPRYILKASILLPLCGSLLLIYRSHLHINFKWGSSEPHKGRNKLLYYPTEGYTIACYKRSNEIESENKVYIRRVLYDYLVKMFCSILHMGKMRQRGCFFTLSAYICLEHFGFGTVIGNPYGNIQINSLDIQHYFVTQTYIKVYVKN